MAYRAACLAIALILAACSAAEDPLADLTVGERGRALRGFDGDAVSLDTVRSVRLIGIEAHAAPYRKREGEPEYEAFKRLPEDMVLGREEELHYAGLTRDRYDRALAHVVTTDALGPRLWMNTEMVKKGGARERVDPDTAAANGPLICMEAKAREEGCVLWKDAARKIHDAARLPEDAARFQMIEGISGAIQGSNKRIAVCEVSLKAAALILEIRKATAELCQLPYGTGILARGFLKDGRLEISHLLNLERLAN